MPHSTVHPLSTTCLHWSAEPSSVLASRAGGTKGAQPQRATDRAGRTREDAFPYSGCLQELSSVFFLPSHDRQWQQQQQEQGEWPAQAGHQKARHWQSRVAAPGQPLPFPVTLPLSSPACRVTLPSSLPAALFPATCPQLRRFQVRSLAVQGWQTARGETQALEPPIWQGRRTVRLCLEGR